MEDRIEQQIDLPTREAVVEKKDLGALWAIGIVLSLLFTLIAFVWNPPLYEPLASRSLDTTEAQIENNQNKMVADALNDGRIQYHSSMEKLVRLRTGFSVFFIDFVKVLLFPTLPIVMVGLLIRKTIRQAKEAG
ncbi:MAG: hypothetical protein WBK96_05570 [Candidatus Manganitrophaceae bacterium]